MHRNYSLPIGYPHQTIKDIHVTLHFLETPDSFLALFGLTKSDIPVGNKRHINGTPNKNVQAYQIINGAHAFNGVAGRVMIYFEENAGWLHVHADPPIAKRMVGIYKAARGEEKYAVTEILFELYDRKQLEEQERLRRNNLLPDSDRLEALLLEGEEMRQRHLKMDEAFFSEEGIAPRPTRQLVDFIRVQPGEISDMLVKEKDLKPEQTTTADVR